MSAQTVIGRLWVDSDEERIRDLMKLVFGTPHLARADFFDWQYRQNPAGRAIIGCCETEDGEIVAVHPVIPVRYRVRGETIMGGIAMNTATHPGFRRQGLFGKSAEPVYSYLAEKGIGITISYPNSYIVKRFMQRLNFVHVGRFSMLVRPHDVTTLLSMKFPFMGSGTLKPFGRLLARMVQRNPGKVVPVSPISDFDGVATETLRSEGDLVVDADRKWLEWRYLKPPHVRNFIVLAGTESDPLGMCIYRFDYRYGLKIAFLVDLLMPETQDLRVASSLVGHVFEKSEECGCIATFALASPRSKRTDLLIGSGFRHIPERLKPHPYDVIFRNNSGAYQPVGINDMGFSEGMTDA